MIPASNSAEHWLCSYVNACGSKRLAAHRLGIPRGTLRRWLKEIDAAGVVHSAPKRVQALKQRLDDIARGTATADALMGIWGFKRVARGDDMTCASFPDNLGDIHNSQTDHSLFDPLVNCEHVEPNENGEKIHLRFVDEKKFGYAPSQLTANDFATSAFATTQGTNTETVQRLMRDSVHGSRIADGKARKPNSSKRIVVVSDLHCGHMVGLTPPGWWYSEHEDLQREMWEWYENEMKAIGEVDACFVVGDTIDGKGSRSGGVEQLTNDLIAQTDMATACLKIIQTDKYFMVHGTPYHVGPDGEHMERLVARNLGGTISGHEWVSVNGCVFDLKHKVGSSGVSYGRHTAVAKEKLWNTLWNLRKMAPKANVILRGHVHYYLDCGGIGWRAMTLPALQGPGSFYGVEQCSGIVDFGFVVFDVDADGKFKWEVHEYNPKIGEPVARVL